ncbi:sterol desaturase family protein [Algoriphagus limi]|uniref:Sterol desaturase family protein n=1 Tax=Algoriphagus limi TaxID=2975273 RepID=A0ABT2G4S3_9BACT|nr:sterol desaturase family protein [Algoriphagus limi]MCS5490199.1 sterol desaturase family protein [Algoriphagus limi]
MKAANSSKQLFENPFLERFSRSNAIAVIASLFGLALIIFLYGVYFRLVPLGLQILLVFAGLFAFSFFEYLIHRYVFHAGNYREGKNWQSKLHGIHHDIPSDRERLTLPMPLALGVSLVVFFLFKFLIGSLAYGFFPGFISGYALYLLVHYWIHTRKPPKNSLKVLWRNHHIHHHVNENKAYGVTTPFWDWVFRTLP